YALLPISFSFLIQLLNNWQNSQPWVGVFLIGLLGLLGLGLAHPNAVFSLALMLIPFALRWWLSWHKKIAINATRMTFSMLLMIGCVIVFTVAWWIIRPTAHWPSFETFAQAFGEVSLLAMIDMQPAFLIAPAVIIGLVIL